MTEHSAQVEALIADYRRSREMLGTVRQELSQVRATASSSDGLITASAGTHGGLLDLSIADAAYTRYRPAELSEAIVRTASVAARQAAEKAATVLAPVLPQDSDPALLLGEAPRPVPAAQTISAGRQDEEEDLAERSWMDEQPGRSR